MLPYYMGILRDKFLLREMIRTGSNMVRAAYGAQDEQVGDMIEDFGRSVQRIKAAAGGPNGAQLQSVATLKTLDFNRDPDCLVGKRWMVRGGNCLWAGPSGQGKSSLEMQTAVYWATGTPIFSLRPTGRLKSVIIQAENDLYDMGEALQGVLAGVSSELDTSDIEDYLTPYRVEGYSGAKFLALLERIIEQHRPDIVWLDPLFAFAGCDLLDARQTGGFLRDGLFPLGSKYGCCLNVIHHTGKPTRGEPKDARYELSQVQYFGFGTSEIQNSFRANNVLIPLGGGVFELWFSKRGDRSGAKDLAGQFSQSIYLSHAPIGQGISWHQCDKPTADGGNASKYDPAVVLGEMSLIHGWDTGALQSHMRKETGMSSATFFRIWPKLKADGKICRDSEDKWILRKD
jgi:hypothetical protein